MGRRIYDSEQVTVTTVPIEHSRSDERTACLIVLSGANVGRVYQLGEVATIGREATAQRVEKDVRNAVFQVASSRLAIDLARKAAEAARLNLVLVADNYTMGLVSLVDLLDAQTNAFNTDLAAADAVNSYLIDLMRTERAVGQFTFFVPPEERAAWIEELEDFDRQRQ